MKKINLAEHGVLMNCEECGNDTFEEAFYVFKVSKFITGETNDTITSVPTFTCKKCGHVNKDFAINVPKETPKTLK